MNRSYLHLQLKRVEMFNRRHTDTQHWNVCAWICVQSFAEGRGSSFSEVSRCCFGLCLHNLLFVLLWEQWHWGFQNGVSESQYQQRSNKNLMLLKLLLYYSRCKVDLSGRKKNVLGAAWVWEVGEGIRLCVFESRLKTKTGRARFRETGKLIQGNGLRHQPAHRSLC